MRRTGLICPVSDLVLGGGQLYCQHMTRLDVLEARGALRRTREFDLGLEDLVKRGEMHELTVLERFRMDGRSIAAISPRPDADAEAPQATRDTTTLAQARR
jgi:hypothetical protein